MKFRKKPVMIEAVQYIQNSKNSQNKIKKLPINSGTSVEFLDDGLFIHTLEGTMRANNYDWIIRGVSGEVYPCKPDIFEATYERVE